MNSYLESGHEYSISKFQLAKLCFDPDTFTMWEKSCVQLRLRNSQVSLLEREILVFGE